MDSGRGGLDLPLPLPFNMETTNVLKSSARRE